MGHTSKWQICTQLLRFLIDFIDCVILAARKSMYVFDVFRQLLVTTENDYVSKEFIVIFMIELGIWVYHWTFIFHW